MTVDRAGVRDLFDLTDRVAIVTGATRGIGRAVAEGMVASGAKVAVASRKADACTATADALRAAGGDAIAVPTHMGDLDDLKALVAATTEAWGRIDIVVNNAATAITEPVGHFTPAAFAKVMDVNLRGPVFLVQEALPWLKTSPAASVINVISVGAFMYSAYVAMYSAAKAGLMGFTRSMAAEYAPHGIRVNALAPGTTDTDMVRANTPEAIKVMETAALLGRMASAEEMIGPALFLASDASSFMTGQVLIVDGGLYPH